MIPVNIGVLIISDGIINGILSGVERVEIPNSVRSIRSGDKNDYAFQQSSSTLTKIDFSDATGITSIGSFAFFRCSRVRTFDLSPLKNLKKLGESVFQGCESAVEFILPELSQLTTLPGLCFADCTSARSIKMPVTIETFDSINGEYGAFERSGFEEILFPEESRLMSIKGRTFYECKLRSITLPKHVVEVSGYSFGKCPNLEKVLVMDGCLYSSKYGILMKTAELVYFPNLVQSGDTARIPEGTDSIGVYAFAEITNYKYVELPSSLKNIAIDAFYASSFVHMKLPKEIEAIASNFARQSNLKQIDYCCSIDIIESFAPNLINLIELNIYGNVARINANAFSNCRQLTKINFPKTLEVIEANAFNCISIENIVLIHTKLTRIESDAFADNQKLRKMYLPASLVSVHSKAFTKTSRRINIFYPGINSITNEAGLSQQSRAYCLDIYPSKSFLGLNVHNFSFNLNTAKCQRCRNNHNLSLVIILTVSTSS